MWKIFLEFIVTHNLSSSPKHSNPCSNSVEAKDVHPLLSPESNGVPNSKAVRAIPARDIGRELGRGLGFLEADDCNAVPLD